MKGSVQRAKKSHEPRHDPPRHHKSFASFMIALQQIVRARRDTSIGDVRTRADKMEEIALRALGKTAPDDAGAKSREESTK